MYSFSASLYRASTASNCSLENRDSDHGFASTFPRLSREGTHLPENDVLQRMDDMIDGKAPDVETSEGRLITLKKGEMLIIGLGQTQLRVCGRDT
eukprot:COSAG02_NODE_13519_length_1383_cov_466.545171_1_plen_95_part_00